MKKLEASSRSGLSQQLRLRNRLQAFYFPPNSQVHISAGGFGIKRLRLESGPAPSAGAFRECSPAHPGVTTSHLVPGLCRCVQRADVEPRAQSERWTAAVWVEMTPFSKVRQFLSRKKKKGSGEVLVLQSATRGPLRCLGLAFFVFVKTKCAPAVCHQPVGPVQGCFINCC